MQLDDIILPDDLLWINEFDWNPVEQNIERSLTGALLAQEGLLKHGRSIILSGNGEAGWVSRKTMKDLWMLSSAVNKIMTLTLPDSRQFAVVFDRSNQPFIKADQVFLYAHPDDKHEYFLGLYLLTVDDFRYANN